MIANGAVGVNPTRRIYFVKVQRVFCLASVLLIDSNVSVIVSANIFDSGIQPWRSIVMQAVLARMTLKVFVSPLPRVEVAVPACTTSAA